MHVEPVFLNGRDTVKRGTPRRARYSRPMLLPSELLEPTM